MMLQTHSPVQSVMTVGIRGSAVLDLETRLKEDVLQEAKACGGRILVHREAKNSPEGDVQVLVTPQWCVVYMSSGTGTMWLRFHFAFLLAGLLHIRTT
jgi:hypothetical protein